MIQLQLLESGYQVLMMAPAPVYEFIQPSELSELSLPSALDLSQPVILSGQVPTWLFGHLVSRCRSAPWIACFSAPVAEAVVIASRVSGVAVGDVISVPLLKPPAPVLVVGGPPDSGKSVFSKALLGAMKRRFPQQQTFLHRGNWDGEGNWSHDITNRELVKRLVTQHERRIHERSDAKERMAVFFEYHAQAVANLQRVVDWVIVDIGGKPQPEKEALLQQCDYGIIISSSPERVAEWQAFFEPQVTLLAIVHSVLADRCDVVRQRPTLEIVAGPWHRQAPCKMPEDILTAISAVLQR